MSVTYAGNEYTDDQFQTAYNTLQSNNPRSLVNRDDFVQELGQQYNGERDLYEVLGYSRDIDEEEYRAKYERQDIAQRIVELPAVDTWKEEPEIAEDIDTETETAFDKAVDKLADRVRLWRAFTRADIATGIGEYGLLFLGINDGQPLDEEIGSVAGAGDLEYVTPFSQDQVIDWDLGRDIGLDASNELYNKPVEYTLSFAEPDEDTDDESHWERVHHSRVIHIAEGKVGSEIKGKPRLRAVFNRLDDLQKVLGASAEMFYAGADQKYHFNVNTKDGQSVDTDALDQMDEEIQQLVHDMEKSIKTINTEMETIGGQEVDPTGVVDNIIKFIAGSVGIPKRILTGSERGELASTQDKANWYGTVSSRQTRFAEPEIVRAFFDRMIEYGFLPSVDGYDIGWPDLFELNELERSKIQKNRANAIATLKKARVFASGEELFDYMTNGEVPEFDEETPESLPPAMKQAQFQRGQQMGAGQGGGNGSGQTGGDDSGGGDGVQDGDSASDGPPDTANDGATLDGQSAIDMANELREYGFTEQAANVSIGSRVETPDGLGVVVDTISETADEETLPGTDLSPTNQTVYVVALVDGGHDFYTVGDLESASFDVEQPDNPSDVIQSANSGGLFRRIRSFLPFASNDWTMPESWRDSDRPSRLILLDAWASMGGQFNCGGSCCMGELDDEELCAAMKDAALGTTEWRGGWTE